MALWLIFQRNAGVHPKIIYVTPTADEMFLHKGPSVQDAIRYKSGKKYSLGLTLSGGGIKCLCQVGALKALEEEGIKPNVISGVSAGAVVAALYADGYSPDSILSIFKNVRYSDFFRLEVPDGGLFSLTGFKEFLDTVLHARSFEELKVPLVVVATDLDRGKSVVFDKGPLVDALVATCSVPILFCPYTIDEVDYADGGVLMNFPASVIRQDCKYLIGINLSLLNADLYEKSITNIALRSYKFIYRSNSNSEKKLCDMLVEPAAISGFNGGDVWRAQEIFQIGYNETKRLLREQIDQKSKNAKK